jgi:hypothetical protein
MLPKKALELPALTEGMDVRIKSTAGTSNVFTLKVTPFNQWGIIGSATQQDGMQVQRWFYNANETGAYSISLGLTTGEFKFRLDNGWTTTMEMMEIICLLMREVISVTVETTPSSKFYYQDVYNMLAF